ncbi:FUSC family protein [Arenibaculum sp.]|jgi:uncharacterized membrane protein YccC|uniref:FUSC family protein n=1 Tax=Arenibaculum sp. TaxID=2865862 RepID=UPI002E101157|nr:FUSC family protein [Arenibaculum sp.]
MRSSLHSLASAYGEPARQAVQAAVAALATFALMKLAALPELSWAVISALFVIQPSVGGTVNSVVGRLLGTVLGTLVGLACVRFIGTQGWMAALSLAVAAVVVEFVASWRPGLRYGHVPAGILIVSSSDMLIDAALDRALAIGIGGVIAGATALLIFPEAAHRRADRALGAALRGCGALLRAAMPGLLATGRDPLGPIHGEVRGHLEQARAMLAQSRRGRAGPRRDGPEYRAVLHAVERLWHTLILIDRVDVEPLPETLRGRLGATLDAFATAACAYLEQLGASVSEGRALPAADQVKGRLRALDDRLAELQRRGEADALPTHAMERVFALAFALEELAGNFDEIADLFRRAERHGRH